MVKRGLNAIGVVGIGIREKIRVCDEEKRRRAADHEYARGGVADAISRYKLIQRLLYIIIGLGKLLVNLTNANAKEAPPVSKIPATNTSETDATTQAVIQLAVKELTGGKGHVAQIKKLS